MAAPGPAPLDSTPVPADSLLVDERPNRVERPPGWRGTWTPSRARLWLIAAAVAAYLPLLGVPLRGWLDFSAFYAAGALAFTPDVARLGPILRYEAAHGLPLAPFVYPAGLVLPYVPFAWLPYGAAAALHVALMTVALVLAAAWGARLLGLPPRWAVLGALAWGPAAAGVISGQNTSLALLLVVASAAGLARGKNLLAGAAGGLLAYKPQLAAPIAGLLLVRGRWRALLVVGVVIAGQYLCGVLATGGNFAWPRDWLDTIAAYTTADFRENGWQAISLPALGMRMDPVLGIQWLVILGYVVGGAIVVACLPSMRRWPPLDAVALACACGLMVSPHAWVYDGTLLLPALGVFAARASERAWPWEDRWLLALAMAIGLTWPFGGFVGVTAMPLLVVAMPFVLLRGGPPEVRRAVA